ncbi:centrosomal protein of 290 kDa-like [Kryptolebias marmoratus]|uniref:centrosomal protein of 290 kDa-like n=1 Tax=Kryptolebias marmoratus TaxID=37003 RepID=UPI0018ACE645|nr:centrosomal protein of 290 kDa-like [Kryptolebias marmoratus]
MATMLALFDWDKVSKLDPVALDKFSEHELDEIIDKFTLTEIWELENKTPDDIVHAFKVFQSLLKIKQRQLSVALNFLEEITEEDARTEKELRTKVKKLEKQLELFGTDTKTDSLKTDFSKLMFELDDKDRELEKSNTIIKTEQLKSYRLANNLKEKEDEVYMLKNSLFKLEKANHQLQLDVKFYQEETEERSLLVSNEKYNDLKKSLKLSNEQLSKSLEDIEKVKNEKKERENLIERLKKSLEQATEEMEKMTERCNNMSRALYKSDKTEDQLKIERDQAKFEVQRLKQIIHRMTESDIKAKEMECMKIVKAKDQEISDLKQQLDSAMSELYENDIPLLKQAINKKDYLINLQNEQLKKYTEEIEENIVLTNELKTAITQNKLLSRLLNNIQNLESKLEAAETRAKQAEQALRLDGKEKDESLAEASIKLSHYKCGTYALNLAFKDYKEWKCKHKMKDSEDMARVMNNLEMRIKDLLEENKDLTHTIVLNHRLEEVLKESRDLRTRRQVGNKFLTKETEQTDKTRLNQKEEWKQTKEKKTAPAEKTATCQVRDCSLQEQITDLHKELESSQKKFYKIAQAWDSAEEANGVSRADMASISVKMSCTSKQITDLEMIEFKQRAERAQNTCETLKNSLKEVEKRNLELESENEELKRNMETKRREGQRNKPANYNALSSVNQNRIKELEKSEEELRIIVHKLQGECSRFEGKMLRYYEDSAKTKEEGKRAEKERIKAEEIAKELKLKIQKLEKLVSTSKDGTEGQKKIDLGNKTKNYHLHKTGAESVFEKDRELIKHLENVVNEKNQTLLSLEKNMQKIKCEHQLALNKLNVELDHQQDQYKKLQNEILNIVAICSEDAGTSQDHMIPVSNQLAFGLDRIRKCVSSTLVMQATCKDLEEKLQKKDAALKKVDHNIWSNHKVINDLRFQLLNSSERDQSLTNPLLSTAHQNILDLQEQIVQKDSTIDRYKYLLFQSNTELNDLKNKHDQELTMLHEQLASESARFRNLTTQSEQMIQELQTSQKVQNTVKANSLCNISVEELQTQLTQKNKELKSLGRALLELRAKFQATETMQQASTSHPKEVESPDIQNQVQRQTASLTVQVQNMNKKLETVAESVKTATDSNAALKEKVECLTQDICRSEKSLKRLQIEQNEQQNEIKGLKQEIQELRNKQPGTESVQTNSRSGAYLKDQLAMNKKKTQLQMTRVWRAKMDRLQKSLKEKEQENEALAKKYNSLNDLHTKLVRQKNALDRKLKVQTRTRGTLRRI